jgi:hypothetical protein
VNVGMLPHTFFTKDASVCTLRGQSISQAQVLPVGLKLINLQQIDIFYCKKSVQEQILAHPNLVNALQRLKNKRQN